MILLILATKMPNCDVVGQETSQSSLAEIVDIKPPSKSIKNTSSALSLGGKKTKAKLLVAPRLV
jgi:hypothetical protein